MPADVIPTVEPDLMSGLFDLHQQLRQCLTDQGRREQSAVEQSFQSVGARRACTNHLSQKTTPENTANRPA